jgi:hypothetical protein
MSEKPSWAADELRLLRLNRRSMSVDLGANCKYGPVRRLPVRGGGPESTRVGGVDASLVDPGGRSDGDRFRRAAVSVVPAGASNPCGATGAFNGTDTCTYTTVGSDTFAVPAGVSSVSAVVVGAGGAGGSGGTGGAGARVTTPLDVTGLSVLSLFIGGGGSSTLLTPPSAGYWDGGGGDGSAIDPTTSHRVIAGGGGGGPSGATLVRMRMAAATAPETTAQEAAAPMASAAATRPIAATPAGVPVFLPPRTRAAAVVTAAAPRAARGAVSTRAVPVTRLRVTVVGLLRVRRIPLSHSRRRRAVTGPS